MKRLVIQLSGFSKILDQLIAQNQLSYDDFVEFERRLVGNPREGNVIQGTGGLRKTRLKSISKGKSGGFRVCYCDVPEKEKLFLLAVFAKNVQENLSFSEKQGLKALVERLKKE